MVSSLKKKISESKIMPMTVQEANQPMFIMAQQPQMGLIQPQQPGMYPMGAPPPPPPGYPQIQPQQPMYPILDMEKY